MTKYPALAANSDAHIHANALLAIAVRNTKEDLGAGSDLIYSLTEDELRMTLAALATQASHHVVKSCGGKEKALRILQIVAAKLSGLN